MIGVEFSFHSLGSILIHKHNYKRGTVMDEENKQQPEEDTQAVEQSSQENIQTIESKETTHTDPIPNEAQHSIEQAAVRPEAPATTASVANTATNQEVNETQKQNKKPRSTRQKILLTTAIVLIIGIIAGGAYMLGGRKNNEKTEDTRTNSDTESVVAEEQNQQTGILTDARWLATAEKVTINPFELFTEAGLVEYWGVESAAELPEEIIVGSYKIGAVDAGEIIIVDLLVPGIGGNAYGVFLKQGSSYSLLKQGRPQGGFFSQDGQYRGPALSSNVTIDETTKYKGLTTEDTITFNGVTASRVGEWSLEGVPEEAQEVAKIDAGTVYEVVISSEYSKGIKNMYILLKQPSNTFVRYRYATKILNDDNSVTVTWKDGSTSTETYQWALVRGGCGSVSHVNVLDKDYFNDLVELGTSGGEKLYTLNSADHPALTTLYESYSMGRDDVVSKQAFYDDGAVVIVRNELSYRVVLVKDKYQHAGECAKPVIYLYPETPLAISVKVGAAITKSEPTYNNGWNVLAMPDGTLLTGNGVFNSLFWDGTGHGQYPEITEGFVVETKHIELTLRDHLAKLGMNQNETADFLEYWLPLMPTTPYIRLTWFGTEQMNQLAPLTLSKQPDTLIRIFLDYQGLESPINIRPQTLSHPERRGFVVTEWGGLKNGYSSNLSN